MTLITRGTNALAHPGAIIRNSSSRRTTEVVQAERAANAEAKAKKAAAKETGIERVAQLENQARKQAKETDLDANNPRDKLTLPRKSRRKKSEPIDTESKIPANHGSMDGLKTFHRRHLRDSE